jgi:dTDP-glucose pyrophosphorylase
MRRAVERFTWKTRWPRKSSKAPARRRTDPGHRRQGQTAVQPAAPPSLKPSARGELEISDLNVVYLQRGQLHVHRLSRGFAWLDAGTSSSLHDASAYVQAIEKRTGIKIGCPEEAAFRGGFLNLTQLEELAGQMPNCEYRTYLNEVVAEAKRLQNDL